MDGGPEAAVTSKHMYVYMQKWISQRGKKKSEWSLGIGNVTVSTPGSEDLNGATIVLRSPPDHNAYPLRYASSYYKLFLQIPDLMEIMGGKIIHST